MSREERIMSEIFSVTGRNLYNNQNPGRTLSLHSRKHWLAIRLPRVEWWGHRKPK